MLEKHEIDDLEFRLAKDCCTRCPHCLRRHTRGCVARRRCRHCEALLTSVSVAELPAFVISTELGPLTVRAENEHLVRRACLAFDLTMFDLVRAAV